MDVSKLPRLSKTGSPESPVDSGQALPPESVAPLPPPVARSTPRPDPVGIGAEVWIAVIVGLILIALGRTYAQYEIARLMHRPFHTNIAWQVGPQEGQEVPYPDLDASLGLPYYSDSGLFWFGVSLLFVALAQLLSITSLRIQVPLGWIALLLLIAAVGYNIFVSAKLFGAGITPILSLLCVAFGGYEAMLQYRLRRPAAAASS